MVDVGGGRAPLVGRATELHVLEQALARLAGGEGGVLALVGAAGVGKSRLARVAAASAEGLGATVLSGRSVSRAGAAAYRPLAEALAPWARSHAPQDVDLGAHSRGAAALVPGWAGTSTDPVAPEFVAESLLRLLPYVSGDAPVLLLLEDLHWADAETLAALEYLADAAEQLALLVVVTARDDEGPETRRLLRALAARGTARLVPLGPLDGAETTALAGAWLGSDVAPGLAALLAERADGLPLLVEELLAALAAGGGLAHGPDGVDVTTAARAVLPDTVADTVAARLDRLADGDRQVLETAALLGRSFDLGLLEQGADGPVEPALVAATGLGLLDEDPDRPGQLRFRHALLRDGVLAATFPPRRAALARRLLDAVLATDPDDDGLAVAVELAERAGDSPLAARLALRRAVAARDRWALASAEQGLAEARDHAGADPELLTEIDLAQLSVASIVGRIELVLRVGQALLGRLDVGERHEAERLDTHLRMAQALLDEARSEEAEAHLAAASSLVGPVDDACSATRLEVELSQAARLRGDPAAARDHAVRAAELGRPYDDQADLVCAALLYEGRAWLPDRTAARERWGAALTHADRHGLRLWRARMLVELATLDVDDLRGEDTLLEASRLARETGGVEAVVRATLLRARLALLRGELPTAQDLLEEAEHLGVASVGSRRAAAALRDALAVLSGRPAAGTDAEVAVLAALVADDLGTARHLAEQGEPGALRLVADLVAARPGAGAVAAARDRLPDLAAAAAVLDAAGLLQALACRVWAPAATGTREPLLAATATLDRLGLSRPAEGCRELLRAAGVPLPRRAAAQEGVPERLRSAGVTARELDVLRLIASGRTNRDVAAELYLSPRTVEKHVERLLLKTGAANRTALAALARAEG